jgi:phosphoglycerate dehydrogenase-like enzyme
MSRSELIRVLVTQPFASKLIQSMRSISSRLEIKHIPTKNPEDLEKYWATVEVLYTAKIVPKPKQAPCLSWIQAHFAGIEHLLKHPITNQVHLTTASGVGAKSIAEYVIGGLLSLNHHIPSFLEHQSQKIWSSKRLQIFVPSELQNTTLGIIGYGGIGQEIAHLANAFGMKILVTKRDISEPSMNRWQFPNPSKIQQDLVAKLYLPEHLHIMLKHCDYVVTAVPLTENTKHMISASEFSAMKKGTVLVNISRGKVVDELALINALQTGHLRGAILDVFETEPLDVKSPLWTLPNVILSPHVSGLTRNYDQRAVELFANNLERYLSGKPLLNEVNIKRGY